MDEDGDMELELPCTMRGYPHLQSGQMVRGRLHSCHNKWLKFNGTVPHATMPFTGSRISLVYFSRKGCLRIMPDSRELLERMNFMLPGEGDLPPPISHDDDPNAPVRAPQKP